MREHFPDKDVLTGEETLLHKLVDFPTLVLDEELLASIDVVQDQRHE